MLEQLLKTPEAKRDDAWVDNFCKSLLTAKLTLLSPDPQQGPDGFPYLMISTDPGEEPFPNVAAWCAERGTGLAINPQKPMPDFVFTNGMLWNYTTRGEFFTERADPSETGRIHLEPQQQVFVGSPNETYWPKQARKNFKEFLVQQGLLNPKFILLAEKAEGPMDIAFSLESLGDPPEAEWDGILEAFSWFFPGHYSLALMNEKNLSGTKFFDI